MSDDALILSRNGAVATLTLNRPQKRNAVNGAMWRALPALLERIETGTRVLIVRGADGNFASGADIDEFEAAFADRETTLAYANDMTAATAAIEALCLPVIAMIEGLCIGAGVSIALACDLRFAAAGAKFAVTPAKLGLMYSVTDTARLVRAVGTTSAKDLLFTARTLTATEAAGIGIVDAVSSSLDGFVAARAEAIAALSPWSVRKAKAAVNLVAASDSENATTRGWFADAIEGPDYREGLAAFRARRPPKFTG